MKPTLTFHESATRFVLDALGYKLENDKIYKDKVHQYCAICGCGLNKKNFAGFFGNKVTCKSNFCLTQVVGIINNE